MTAAERARHIPKIDRNDVEVTIADRFLAGDGITVLALDYGLEDTQVEMILRRRLIGVRRVLS